MEKKLYSLVIVDDEVTIRRGMCSYIDWAGMGFRVTADFEDGKETIEYLKTHPVDVILTDVQMAEVSGLQLAQYVFESKLPTKVVIISGYKEFEYARQALQYNVVDYILKPIHMDEMEKIFTKIYGQLQDETQKQAGVQMRQQDFEEIVPELQEQFWMGILLGGLRNKDNIIRKRELLSLKFSTRTPCAVVSVKIQIDEARTQKYFLQKKNRYNLLNNIFAGENDGLTFHPVYLSAEHLKLVVTTEKEMSNMVFECALEDQLQKKTEEVRTLLSLEMQVKKECSFSNITELTDHYCTMKIHVQKKSEKEYTLYPEDYERLLQKYQLLMDTINGGDFEALDCLTENILLELRSLPLGEVKNLLVDMFSMLMQKFIKMSPQLWLEVKEKVDYSQILEVEDRGQMKEVCAVLLKQIMEIVGRRQNEVSRDIVDKIIDYLKRHYHEDISLDLLADRYYLNSSYLSRLFKQCTGTCLTDYLIELRMEQAKELLLTGKYRVYEISQKVGYKNDKYFFRVFKQYTGQSPSEFCRSHMDEKMR